MPSLTTSFQIPNHTETQQTARKTGRGAPAYPDGEICSLFSAACMITAHELPTASEPVASET